MAMLLIIILVVNKTGFIVIVNIDYIIKKTL